MAGIKSVYGAVGVWFDWFLCIFNTHGEKGKCFKKTYSGIYSKWPNS